MLNGSLMAKGRIVKQPHSGCEDLIENGNYVKKCIVKMETNFRQVVGYAYECTITQFHISVFLNEDLTQNTLKSMERLVNMKAYLFTSFQTIHIQSIFKQCHLFSPHICLCLPLLLIKLRTVHLQSAVQIFRYSCPIC